MARELGKLAERPEWAVLRKEFDGYKREYLAATARKLVVGGDDAAPLDQRKVDYRRGWLRGVETVLAAPERAIAELDKLRKEADADG